MVLSRRDQRVRACCGAAALLAVAALIAGCSSLNTASPAGAPANSGLSSFFSSARQNTPQAAPAAPEFNYECPGTDFRRGAAVLNVAEKSGNATAGDLRYQLSLRQLARECLAHAETMTIRVGVLGRIILGPYGSPGPIDVPLRYAVVREGPEPRPIVSKFKRLTVMVPPGGANLEFTDVEENLTFPIPSTAELSRYVVYVGFDEVGEPNEKKPARTAKKNRKKSR
jgi:hypothetical protein